MNTKSLVLILAAQFMICGFISAQKSDKEASQEILIGGNFFKDDLNEASLKQLKDFSSLIQTDNKNQTVLFLGNTLPDLDMDPESADYIEATQDLGPIIQENRQRSKRSYYLPGNNEWNAGKNYTVKALKQSEKFVEAYSDDKNRFVPSKGCGEPRVLKLNDALMLIILDSQWMMQDDSKDARQKSSCEIDNNFELIAHVKELIAKNKAKHIVIAAHHPLYSDGKLGGNYRLKDHLLPLPVLGTLISSVRKLAVDEQAPGHPKYEQYIAALKSMISSCEDCVVVSSHENNLQYHTDNYNHFFTVGSGADSDYTRAHDAAEFSSGTSGYARISINPEKSLKIELFDLNSSSKDKALFSKIIEPKITELEEEKFNYGKELASSKESISLSAAPQYAKRGFLRGKFYRDAWTQELEFPVLDLESTHGGLKPIQQGGGFQTKSLRLENDKGQQWVLRSINKDVEKIIPPALRKSFAQNLVQEGIASSHPYGAFVVPHLAKLAGVYHARPKAVYLPYQKNLGDYNQDYGNKLYLFEERPGGTTEEFENYGYTKKTVNTLDLIDKLKNNHKHQVDQTAVLRARIFDIWLGDWDRHDDQWRWASFEDGDKTIYRPVPRDRDQVFFKNDGFLDYLVARPYFNPGLRKFDHKIDFLPGLIFNARHFDRSFLNATGKLEFIKAAENLQTVMTDEVIENAIKSWPQEIFDIDGEEVISKLISRRDALAKTAAEYYEHINKEITIHGTDDKNFFRIELLENDITQIRVYHKKEDEDHMIYAHTINGADCKELRLFGLKKDDVFSFSGQNSSSIKFRVIGGGGDDMVQNDSKAKILVYDRPKGMELGGNKVKSKLADETGINHYDRKDWQQNRFWQFPIPSFYTDEGLGIAYNIWWKKFGFRSDPFKSDHRLSMAYYYQNSAFALKYNSLYPKLIGNWDLGIDLSFNGPSFTQLFFGFGNNYIDFAELYPNIEGAGNQRFNIVKGHHLTFLPKLERQLNASSSFSVTAGMEYINLKDDDDDPRYYLLPGSGIPGDYLIGKIYPTLALAFNTQRIDNPANPSRGYMINLEARSRINTENSEYKHVNLAAEISAYIPFDQSKKLILSSHMGAAHLVGEMEFFHFNYLAGRSRLRAYRTNRFSGRSMAYHSNDLRIGLLKTGGDLPSSMGLIASFDYGRVWLDDEESDTWHTSYGGGFYFAPFELFGLKFTYHKAKEEFQLGFAASLAF